MKIVLAVLLAVMAGGPRVLSAQPLTSSRVLMILVDWPGTTAPPESTVPSSLDAVNFTTAFYHAQSYNQFTLTIDTTGIYTLAVIPSGEAEIRMLAKAAASGAGVDLSLYDRFVYVSPRLSFMAGGYSEGVDVWIAPWPNQLFPPSYDTLAHELGHTFGQPHHSSLQCADGTPLGPAQNGDGCTRFEYGNHLSVMGSGYGDFVAYGKEILGWLTPSGAYRVQMIAASGDYTLSPLESPTSGVKALGLSFRVNAGSGVRYTETYYLEYRQALGFGPYQTSFIDPANLTNGVLVTWGPWPYQLLMMNPPAQKERPALTVGQSWCHPLRKFRVTTLSATADAATVHVDFLKGKEGC